MRMHGRFAQPGARADGVRQDAAPVVEKGRLSFGRGLLERVRLVGRMLRDSRVSLVDRLFVLLAIGYLVLPFDLVPDVIPFIGEVDDIMLLVAALTRLFERAEHGVILSHWHGRPEDLEIPWLRRILRWISVVFPAGTRRRMRALARQ